ncbi:MAG: Txe/YoeB family addiction module toxin [Candidatus Thiothrix putei]|uniref:Toxin YoeB n=1 Tax=Candidatus Thiothrix putei TaxID=3080811 RepID=A0AA95HCZ2_9GAMM|nr:Txe/YoeB family addiction module toxin [Thiothrix caldifontis]WGZ95157.1 MAG: Txe/YoeB family addiction module toxin [Candidatus Thiothrix putei]
MRIIFSSKAWEDYVHWQQADKKILKRINDLIKAISRDPFDGIGKPEPLRHGLSGYWSRRINDEHRLIYKVEGEDFLIAMCRYHYQ